MTTERRRKCLLFCYQTPRSAGGGGEVRSYHMVQTALDLFDVTLISMGGLSGTEQIPDEIAQRCERVIQPSPGSTHHKYTKPPTRPGKWWLLLTTLLLPWRDHWIPINALMMQYCNLRQYPSRGAAVIARLVILSCQLCSRLGIAVPPMQARNFAPSWKLVEKEAIAAAARSRYDVFWVEHTLGWPIARRIVPAGTPIICSSHNIEHLLVKHLGSSTSQGVPARYSMLEYRHMQRAEIDAWTRSSIVIQCSDNDSNTTRQLAPNVSAITAPNGVDTGYFHTEPDAEESDEAVLLLTAGFGYAPNSQGLQWFLQHVYPLIRSQRPDVKFLFAGSAAGAAAERLGPLPDGVEFNSDPQDIRPSFRRALVYVVPLLAGGGTRLKILEAMAMNLPVVSTRIGADGVAYEHERHLLLADSPEDFAAAAIRLLDSTELRDRLRRNGRELVSAGFEWDAIRAKTAAEIRELL